MEHPLIAVTGYNTNENDQFYLSRKYICSLRLVGAIPLILPPGEDNLQEFFDRVDGIVFSGGGDVHPKNYQGNCKHERLYGMNEERDTSEIALLKIALEREKPVLAICRGMQLTNVVMGGTLMEHLPEYVGEKTVHRHPENGPVHHEVTVAEDSRLLKPQSSSKIAPASWHHQAIKNLGQGLKAVAYAEDGIVEAFEVPNHPWFLGVQWHPEITADEDDFQRKILTDFVERARTHKEHMARKAS